MIRYATLLAITAVLLAAPPAGAAWMEVQSIEGSADEKLGLAVDISGSTLMVGATPVNRVSVYNNTGGTWTFNTDLSPGPATSPFGGAVEIDGGTVAVGGRSNSGGTANVFDESGGTWSTQVTQATNPDRFYGSAVDKAADTLLVGSMRDAAAGSAYIYEGPAWNLTATITNPSPSDNNFGRSVYLADATTALVGSIRQAGGGTNQGQVFEYTKNGGGWSLNQTLTGPDDGGEFGSSIAGVGDLLVVGAKAELNATAGSAIVYERDGGGTWNLIQTLTPSVGPSNLEFGADVATDGNTIVVGTFIGARGVPGNAYVFEKSGGSWVETQILSASDGHDNDRFGTKVAVDGDWIAVGASFWGNNLEGKAYLFQIPEPGTLSLLAAAGLILGPLTRRRRGERR